MERKRQTTMVSRVCVVGLGHFERPIARSDSETHAWLLSLYHKCDSTTIRLRHDYDEKLTCSFFARVELRRMEAGARDTS